MLGLHLTFSTYGFWLPNDPRGSGSSRVRAQHLHEASGQATKVFTTHSVAAREHDVASRLHGKESLKHPAIVLTGFQAKAVADGIAQVCGKIALQIHAFSIMPDHVHAVVAKHRLEPDELLGCLKRAGTRGLNAQKLHPFAHCPRANGKLPSPWAAGGWKVFLDTVNDMRRAIHYVKQNPIRAGLGAQRWPFVVSFME